MFRVWVREFCLQCGDRRGKWVLLLRFLGDCEKGGEERMGVLGLDEDLLCGGDTMLPSVNVGFNELQEDFGGDQAVSLPLKIIYSTAKSSPLPFPDVWGRSYY